MTKDSFFGRQNYLEILEKRIHDLKDGYRQNIAIVGDELVGKTSIIFKFLSKFCDNRSIVLYLEARPEPLSTFAKRFIGVLLYNFLVNSNIPLKEDLDFLILKSARYIPKTTEKIKAILTSLQKRKKNNVFTELLSVCDSIYQETQKHCIVVLDEFHNLEKMGVKNIYAEWSKLLITQKKTMYIIISSLEYKARNILAKNLALLFGNFEILTVEAFDIKSSESYLASRLQGTKLGQGEQDFLINFTGGYPFYLEIISDALLKAQGRDLVEVLEGLLFLPSGILNQRFSNYLKRFLDLAQSQEYISILYQVSSGHNRLKDIVHALRKPKEELNSRINHLVEAAAVTRSGDFLKINDRVFSFWLKFVYQEKINSLTFDAKNQKELFRNHIEGMIQEFLSHTKKPVINRVMELLHLFENETIQIERRKLRLKNFREVKPLEFGQGNIKEAIIGRSSDSLWIVAFKKGLLTEDDILVFAKECKKYHQKLERKIIIAFADVEANARLRALEEKIWTWDLNSLNQVLDLFSKPRIIL